MVVPTPLRFSKMHGAGNDFVIIDLRDGNAPTADQCRRLSNRHTGVGCDQILGIDYPRSATAIASYKIWTADGSPSQQCGNGARCVAAWLARAGLARQTRFFLDSPSRTHAVEMISDNYVEVAMGVPQFALDAIPLGGFAEESDQYESYLDGTARHRFAALSMGNPHAVIVVDDLESAPVSDTGRALQQSRHLPPSVNVGFVKIDTPDRLFLRVHEYGAGETLACGSGACAAAAVLIKRGQVNRDVTVVQSGGDLRIRWPELAAEIVMAGPAAFVFEGTLQQDSRS